MSKGLGLPIKSTGESKAALGDDVKPSSKELAPVNHLHAKKKLEHINKISMKDPIQIIEEHKKKSTILNKLPSSEENSKMGKT